MQNRSIMVGSHVEVHPVDTVCERARCGGAVYVCERCRFQRRENHGARTVKSNREDRPLAGPATPPRKIDMLTIPLCSPIKTHHRQMNNAEKFRRKASLRIDFQITALEGLAFSSPGAFRAAGDGNFLRRSPRTTPQFLREAYGCLREYADHAARPRLPTYP